MLEVKNLKRVYKVKGSDPVYALNDVSLKFPETGLVFILGKSGSGKSTLLNVMGGLDNVDDGEIIINGKSSKTFSKVEMDSYRNTYLGFIFQEYNILSDFTVRENIALALQLQHKKATDEIINSILQEVDLVGYGKRKPNELSGGQKQRVAIARALVKEPKIIFGDEPTGALDSNTGKQVFQTLKKLSETRLVVIVSHDRDFAEHFGDRVIELKDGQVISDITKTAVISEKTSDGLALIGDNIIRLDKDRPLKEEDLPLINKAIANSEKEVYIVADAHVNNALCEAAKIDKDGNREEFVDTDPDQIKVGHDEFKPIKSRFSLGRAFRMGAKSLRVKPFRLAMTILLSTVAFSLFGASLTLSFFNTKSAMTSAISKNNMTSLPFTINEQGGNGLTDEKVKEIEKETGAKIYYADSIDSSLTVPSSQDLFHLKRYKGKMPIDEKGLTDFAFSLVSGSFPSNESECAIPLYAYYSYKDLGIGYDTKSEDYIAPDKVDYSSVIGTSVSYSDYSSGKSLTYKISGIIDTKLPDSLSAYRNKTEDLNNSSDDARALYMLSMGQQVSVHNSIFVSANGYSSSNATSRVGYALWQGNDSALSKFLDSYLNRKNVAKDAGYDWEEMPSGYWYLSISDSAIAMVETTSMVILILTQVFLYVGIAMAIFSMLLFYNFISVSINNKKREIGILRAVGAKRIDVFKIFYSEAFIIAMVNFILSTVSVFLISWSVNKDLAKNSFFGFNLMSPDIRVVGALFAAAIVASFISAFLPVIKIANKKPIDAIHNK